MRKKVEKDAAYWLDIVASAATVQMHLITEYAPKGFAKAIGSHRWYSVRLGPLALAHNGEWVFVRRNETTKGLMKYAHKNSKSAFAALRAEVAPFEPDCAAQCEDMFAESDKREGR